MEATWRGTDALDRFERQTTLPMLVLALAIPLLVIPLVIELSPSLETTFTDRHGGRVASP